MTTRLLPVIILLTACVIPEPERALEEAEVLERYSTAVCTHMVDACGPEDGVGPVTQELYDRCVYTVQSLVIYELRENHWPLPTSEAQMAACEDMLSTFDECWSPERDLLFWYSPECNFGQT